MDEGTGDDNEPGLSGKRYLVVEIGVVMAVLWLPGGWYATRALLGPVEPATSIADPIGRLIHDLGFVAILAFVIWGAGERFGRFGMGRLRIRDAWVFVAAACLGFVSDVLISSAWTARYAPHPAVPSTPMRSHGWLYWLLLAVATTGSAAYQETLMRGYLITRLEDLWGSGWLAFAASCLLFAYWHAYQDGYGIAMSAILGAIYGLLFLRYRRVWPLVAAHAVANMLIYTHVVSALARSLAGFYAGTGLGG